MSVDRLRATIVTLKPLGNINTNPMMLKKYRVVEIMYCNERVIFRRSTKDGDWRCGVDCKIKCNTNIDCGDIYPKCNDWQGIWKRIDIEYAYYPPRDDTKEK